MGYRITPTAIDAYMEKVPRDHLTSTRLTRDDARRRIMNAIKNPSGESVIQDDGSVYTPATFRNGCNRAYFLVSGQGKPSLIVGLITLQEYRERF